MSNLSTTYLGLKLKNPLIAGSCGLTGDVKNVMEFEKKGISAVVLKSLFEEEIIREIDSNLKRMASDQFIYPETIDFYDKEIKDDKITSKYLGLIDNCKKNTSIPIIASVNCISAEHWMYFPKRIEQAGADALELNIFVLPSDINKNAADNEKTYFDIIHAVKKQINIPVAVKISYFSSDLGQFINKLSQTGINGIVLFNRFYNPDFDINTLKLVSSNVLSNPSDLTTSLRWIALMQGKVDCDLAASTGIHDHTGLIKQLLAGANAVQIVSALYKNGPEHIEIMLNGLENWMQEKGYKSIDGFRGKMGHKNIENPAACERVQFMKYLRGYRPDMSFSDDV